MADNTEKQQFNIYIPRALVRRLKLNAVEANMPLSRYVEQILLRGLDNMDDPDHESSSAKISKEQRDDND